VEEQLSALSRGRDSRLRSRIIRSQSSPRGHPASRTYPRATCGNEQLSKLTCLSQDVTPWCTVGILPSTSGAEACACTKSLLLAQKIPLLNAYLCKAGFRRHHLTRPQHLPSMSRLGTGPTEHGGAAIESACFGSTDKPGGSTPIQFEAVRDPGRVKTQKGRLQRGIAFYRRCKFRVVLLLVARTLRMRGGSFYAFLAFRRFRTAKTPY